MNDERYFSNASSFIPTRWIDSERGAETCTKAAWLPFSHGLRNCVGKSYALVSFINSSLAMMEMKMTLAMFIWHFDAEFAEIGQPEPYFKDGFLALRGPLPIHLKPVRRP
jgi:cytochrome P450